VLSPTNAQRETLSPECSNSPETFDICSDSDCLTLSFISKVSTYTQLAAERVAARRYLSLSRPRSAGGETFKQNAHLAYTGRVAA